MESMNKFKVLTIMVMCMFVFVIAAIYVNTKDATANKTKNTEQIKQERIKDSIQTKVDDNNQVVSDLSNKIDVMNARIEELNQRIDNQNSNDGKLNCRVYGVLTPAGIEKMMTEDAIDDVRRNNNELVITCGGI